jgi:hypothetical protein
MFIEYFQFEDMSLQKSVADCFSSVELSPTLSKVQACC